MTNASQQVHTKELSLLTVRAAWNVTNTTHSATKAEPCDVMVPFTLSHPGLNPVSPFQLAESILLVIQYDFIYFKALSQCYQDTHCPRHCLHD